MLQAELSKWMRAGSHRLTITEQPQRVRDDEKRRPFVDDDRRADVEAEDRRWNEKRDDAEARPQVLFDDRARLPAEAESERQAPQIVRHRGDGGGGERDVGARRAHGDADSRLGERRSVIDAVADHGDGAFLASELADKGGFIFRHERAARLAEPYFHGDGVSDFLIVAGQHDHSPDAELAQFGDDRASEFAFDVEKAKRAEIACAAAHDDYGSARLFQAARGVSDVVRHRRLILAVEHRRLADMHEIARDNALYALAGDAFDGARPKP